MFGFPEKSKTYLREHIIYEIVLKDIFLLYIQISLNDQTLSLLSSGSSNTVPLCFLSEVMASCTGHLVIPVDRCHQRRWRWSSVIPNATLTHTAANWQSHTWVPMTQVFTAVNTPKMVQTTSPQPMSTLKVRPAKQSDLFKLLSNTASEPVRACRNLSTMYFPTWEKLNGMLFRKTKNYSKRQMRVISCELLSCFSSIQDLTVFVFLKLMEDSW